MPRGPQGFFSASAIRGCAIDCAYQDRPQRVSGVTVTGSEAVVDTPLPHLLTTGQWVRISGARVASATNQFDNDFNGSFKVTVLTSTQFKYSLPSSGLLSPSGDIWSGRWPSQRIPLNPGATVGVSGLSQISVSPNVWKMQVKTSTPHYAVPGGMIVLNSVIPSSGTPPNVPLNGVWRVTRVLSNKDFVCQAEFAASQVPMSPTNLSAAFIVPNFHGMSIGGGTVGIAVNSVALSGSSWASLEPLIDADEELNDRFHQRSSAVSMDRINALRVVIMAQRVFHRPASP